MFFLFRCVKCVDIQYPCLTISCSGKITLWMNALCQDQSIISHWSDLWVKENWRLYWLQLWIYSRNKNDIHALHLLSCGVNGDTVSVSSVQSCSINVSAGIMYSSTQKINSVCKCKICHLPYPEGKACNIFKIHYGLFNEDASCSDLIVFNGTHAGGGTHSKNCWAN
jgi:hypothetical protein